MFDINLPRLRWFIHPNCTVLATIKDSRDQRKESCLAQVLWQYSIKFIGLQTYHSHITKPPLTSKMVPLTKSLSIRLATARATSSAVPSRRSGVLDSMCLMFVADRAARVEGVSMKPGATALHRIPKRPNSLDQVTVIALTPAFAAEYAVCPSLPRALMELIFTIEPRRRRRAICSTTAAVTMKTDSRLAEIQRRNRPRSCII
ncbi:hypothetical protein BOSE62_110350 [Bosea sp. 62]|nr:hypothetical protein BOSE21B_50239 [Bosea sp. 21B]CAD5288194.1 hypothetical protein BOSE46_70230 [Bosea sp. 46]CAD5301468.1 hypothetical protein BOSE7B_90449 [Bosea sp. 7B]VVT51072.1 hypothetical protein BOS5A_110211 [Bosea sp. EC-HK365B]VXB08716.1 hypothetical protein BOSE62_110350 [Bosea sp. 62]VXB69952.1 hypothetical protein BOSE127_140393 [Bosea sp. 127]VXC57906.1 hypothetical protein BOSE29B_50230 [Bosea sp. 29B]VXC91141.1 hypothetical protein BOSE125_70294 [Bosea sp. 125]